MVQKNQFGEKMVNMYKLIFDRVNDFFFKKGGYIMVQNGLKYQEKMLKIPFFFVHFYTNFVDFCGLT